MTAKEKAEELVGKFFDAEDSEGRAMFYFKEDAKKCALVSVDEMTKILPFTDLNTYMGKWCERQRDYLNEVKLEIEKL